MARIEGDPRFQRRKGLVTLQLRPSIALTAGMAVVTALLGIGAPASAQNLSPAEPTHSIAKADLDYLNRSFDKFGLDESIRSRLLEKWAAGQAFDSETPGANPVSSVTTRHGDFVRTTNRYADGSVSAANLEQPEARLGSARARDITECDHSQSADQHWMSGCKISWENLSWHVHFFADYNWYQFGSNITSISGLIWGGAGSFEKDKLEYLVKNAQGRNTHAKAQGTVIQSTVVFSRRIGVRLDVCACRPGGKSSMIEE